jgi:hypothetical protein
LILAGLAPRQIVPIVVPVLLARLALVALVTVLATAQSAHAASAAATVAPAHHDTSTSAPLHLDPIALDAHVPLLHVALVVTEHRPSPSAPSVTRDYRWFPSGLSPPSLS